MSVESNGASQIAYRNINPKRESNCSTFAEFAGPLPVYSRDEEWLFILRSRIDAGHSSVAVFERWEDFLRECAHRCYPVIVVDCDLMNGNLASNLEALRDKAPRTQMIIMGTGGKSFKSLRDFENLFATLEKESTDCATFESIIRSALRYERMSQLCVQLWHALEDDQQLRSLLAASRSATESRIEDTGMLVGRSGAMRDVRRQIAQVAASNITVLVQGESGTGKDIVARLIHQMSERASKPFIKVNCPSIPDSLMEAELFGHEKGAFTDAKGRRPGRFELASTGTIFLDELSELPLGVQAKLLRVLEHKEFYRVGGTKLVHADIRIVVASNRDLPAMIDRKEFRTDLFYRINEYGIYMPSLRERLDDIPLLVDHFLRKHGGEEAYLGARINDATLSNMMQYSWPGNVRELEAAVKRFLVTGDQQSLLPRKRVKDTPEQASPSPLRNYAQAGASIKKTEIDLIYDALHRHAWNRRKAARDLGISYSTLRRRIDEYNIQPVGT